MSPFIWVKDGVLDAEFCKDVIHKFDKDERSRPGQTSNGVDTKVKTSLDLQISTLDDWKKEDAVFFGALSNHLDVYQAHLDNILPDIPIFGSRDVRDYGYQIQKTAPGEEYVWHQDSRFEDGYARVLTYIWYLNDVDEGGETEFYDGSIIKPVAGRMVIFPATWTFMHRGKTPSTDKYIVTGWMAHKQRVTHE